MNLSRRILVGMMAALLSLGVVACEVDDTGDPLVDDPMDDGAGDPMDDGVGEPMDDPTP